MYYNVLQKEVLIMAQISLRVTDNEKRCIENYAKLHETNISDAMKTAFFEKMEDEYDLQTIKEYESVNHKFYSLSEVEKELEL